MSRRDDRGRRHVRALSVLLALAAFASTGCVGYLIGWSSAEVERSRRIIAELEAKNAELVEELLRLRSASGLARPPAAPGEVPRETGGGSTCRN